jgi:hypothetical protein
LKHTLAPLALAAAGAFLLTSCSGSSESDPSPAKTTTNINYNGTYQDASHLRDAYIEAGGTCPGQGTPDGDSATRIECDDDKTLIVMDSADELGYGIGFEMLQDRAVLSTKNWLISAAESSTLEELQEEMGGDIDDPSVRESLRLVNADDPVVMPTRQFTGVSELRTLYDQAGFGCSKGHQVATDSWQCEDGTYLMSLPDRFSSAGVTATGMLNDQLPAKSQNFLRLENTAIVHPDINYLWHIAGYFGGVPSNTAEGS